MPANLTPVYKEAEAKYKAAVTREEKIAALEAEVLNLKTGKAAAEERARTDLGMIGRAETFYQVIPPRSEQQFADAGN